MKKRKTKAGTSGAADRKALFVKAYLSNGQNATQAAITAGYSKATAYSSGSRLLKDVEIKRQIDEVRTKVQGIAGLSVERTLQEVGRLAYSDMRKVFQATGKPKTILDMDDDTAACISSYEVDKDGVVKIKFWDKNAAHEKAMKFHGLYEADNRQKPEPPLLSREELLLETARNLGFLLSAADKALSVVSEQKGPTDGK